MKPPPPTRDDLLADVLAEAEPPDFRAHLLGETLRLARRRRRGRQASRAAAALALLGLAGAFFWPRPAPPSQLGIARQPAPPRGYTLVTTQPLVEAAVVRTAPLATSQIIATTATVPRVETRSGAPYLRLIDDAGLLALAPRPAALVRVGPEALELIFTDTEALR